MTASLPPDVLRSLPERLTDPTAWQNALRLALPRLCPIWLGRQIPGAHEAKGGWLHGMPKGAADLTGMARGGLRVEIEAKLGSGRLEPDQKRWRKLCQSWGALHLVATANLTDRTVDQVLRFAAELNAALAARGIPS